MSQYYHFSISLTQKEKNQLEEVTTFLKIPKIEIFRLGLKKARELKQKI